MKRWLVGKQMLSVGVRIEAKSGPLCEPGGMRVNRKMISRANEDITG